MSSSHSGTRRTSPALAAGEVQALLAEWISLAEAVITALDHEDTDGVAHAMRGRNDLMPQIEEAVRALTTAPPPAPQPRVGSPGAGAAAQLPLAQIIADVQASDARLMHSVRARLNQLREQLGQPGDLGPAASAYRQLGGEDLAALRVTG